jgi:hypothetical protein
LRRKFPESELGNKSTEQVVNSEKLGIKSSHGNLEKMTGMGRMNPKRTLSPKPVDRAERRAKDESSNEHYHPLLPKRCGFVKLSLAVGFAFHGCEEFEEAH